MGLVTDLDLPGFTSGTIDGTGVFDVLMKATKAHLKEEYDKGRVKGSDYAQLVSNVTVTVLQQAVAFYTQSEIGKNNIEKIKAETDLDRKNIDKVQAEIDLDQKSIERMQSEIDLSEKSIERMQSEIDLDQNNIEKIQAEIDLSEKSIDKIQAETDLDRKNIERMQAEIDLSENSIQKMQAEITLLEQKAQTEKAQTEGKVQKVAGVWNLLPDADPLHVGGKVGQEMILHATQADGFLRDAEQKATKMVLDTWNIRRSTDTGTIPSATSNITDVEIGKFVQKMGDGINISV